MSKPVLATSKASEFASIEAILDELRSGRMVIMVDDEDRENEGDLIMLASKVNAQSINYMARYGRGLICMTMTRERCEQLRLPLMVSDTDAKKSTNFTVSIEAAEGITTGISAHDRARTVQAAVAKDAKPEDLVQPGHIFPIMAQPGGVLTRAGHTEAGCDLARLAGDESAAVIVEILNEDGTMARRPDLEKFAGEHKLLIGTIADLIRYRLEKEISVERIASVPVKTDAGEFMMHAYEDHVNRSVHLALVYGQINPATPPLVRVHLTDTLGDVVGVRDPMLGWPLPDAMQRIANEGAGVVVLLRQTEEPRRLLETIGALAKPQDKSNEQGDDDGRVLRQYGVGAQILRDLGVRQMRVLSAPKQMSAISGFGLEIVEYVNNG